MVGQWPVSSQLVSRSIVTKSHRQGMQVRPPVIKHISGTRSLLGDAATRVLEDGGGAPRQGNNGQWQDRMCVRNVAAWRTWPASCYVPYETGAMSWRT